MNIELTKKQFRRLLDMAYIGNWVLNSARGQDRFADYDEVESLLFSFCEGEGLEQLYESVDGEYLPSKPFVEGGIHEAIMDYEDAVFYDILSEELARRDMNREGVSQSDFEELARRVDDYLSEFDENGIDNIVLE